MKLRHLYFIVIALLPAGRHVGAQSVPARLDSLLAHTLDSMHQVLDNQGMGAAVILPDGAIWSGAAGVSSENPFEAVSTEHVFSIGSVNKTITAAAVLQMAEEGRLSLDDPLHKWLDTIRLVNPNITIRQLLRHQSGLYDVITAPNFQPTMNADPDSIWALADVIHTFIQKPLFSPGTAFSYSNTNYLLLGMIIETISGRPYHEAIRERFLDPLYLSSFSMPPFEPFPQPVAHLWLNLDNDAAPEDAHNIFINFDAFYSSAGPAGSYFSTPADIAQWMQLLMSGELLAPTTMTAMTTTVNTPFSGGTKYGLGVMERTILNQKAYGHGGDAGYSASVWYFPNKDISIAVLNSDGRRNSWSLVPTVAALLKAYTDYENLVVDTQSPALPTLDVAVFPNPFIDRLTVGVQAPAGTSELRLLLTNALGQPVKEAIFRHPAGLERFQLDQLGGLPGGAYFLRLAVDGRWLAGQEVLVRE